MPPPNLKQLAKFAGFTKTAETAAVGVSKLWSGERSVTHLLSGSLLSTTIKEAEGEAAFITTVLGEKTARIASSKAWIGGRGHGEAGVKSVAEYLFEKTGIRELTSDIEGGTEEPAKRMWRRMVKAKAAEPFLYEKAGVKEIGWKITPETLARGRAEQAAQAAMRKIEKAGMMSKDQDALRVMSESGRSVAGPAPHGKFTGQRGGHSNGPSGI